MEFPLPADALVLTPTPRLARWLLLQHNRHQVGLNKKIWDTPAIVPLDAWLRETWLQSWPKGYPLSHFQSRKLWESIIRSHQKTLAQDILHLRGVATQAAQAYQLLCEYRVPLEKSDFQWTEESESFYRWTHNYRQKLKEANAFDPYELLDHVSEGMKQGDISIPPRIVLAGFDQLTPQIEHCLEVLKDLSVEIARTPLSPDLSNRETMVELKERVSVGGFENRLQECVQCSRWVRSVYQPGATVGILVPDHSFYRDLLMRELSAELAPASMLPWEEAPLPFNLSLGKPLIQETMIHQALEWLSFPNSRLSVSSWVHILNSTTLKGAETEHSLRLDIERELIQDGCVDASIHSVIDKFSIPENSHLRKTLRHLQSWSDMRETWTPSRWAVKLSQLLHRIGWPAGDNSLTSLQKQVLDSWSACLDDLSSLDSISGPMGRLAAMEILHEIAQNKIFQIKTREEPIQIMSLEEAAGMDFDYLWIMGLHAEIFPPAPTPNPFIPLQLQNKHNLHDSSAERSLEYWDAIMISRMRLAQKIVLSYPQIEEDVDLIPSPWINSFSNKPEIQLIETSHRLEDHFPSPEIQETMEEPMVLPIQKAELEKIGGGSSLIKNQTECPFRAFAIHRLNAKSREIQEVDLDSPQRGDLVHQTLENIWNEIRTHQKLEELIESKELGKVIESGVQQALDKITPGLAQQPQFHGMEKERLCDLAKTWLSFEKDRPPFTVVLREKKIQLTLCNLTLTLKVDRIDQTEDGHNILIDYKTGSLPQLKNWFIPRLQEPQLPLYTLAFPVEAVSLAQVKRVKPRFVGVARTEKLMPLNKPDQYKRDTGIENWDSLLKIWKTHLSQIAGQFMDGHIPVDPFDPNQSCTYCKLESLCRKYEWMAPVEPESAEEDH